MAEPATRPAPPALETDALREQIRAELEAEHQLRLERFAQRRHEAHQQGHHKAEQRQRREAEDLREKERRRFYEEKGYKEYVDSNGRSEWLPAEEHDWRVRRRKRRDRGGEYSPQLGRRRRDLVIYAVAALIAVVIGLALIG